MMTEIDEQIKLARMGAFEEGATQMQEIAKSAPCTCSDRFRGSSAPLHELSCPVDVWGRAAKLLRTLKAAEEANGDMPWYEV
jgi:hypothetical protein